MPSGSMFSRLYQECNEHVIVTSRVIDDVPKSVFVEQSLCSRYCVTSFTRIVSGHHEQSITKQNRQTDITKDSDTGNLFNNCHKSS